MLRDVNYAVVVVVVRTEAPDRSQSGYAVTTAVHALHNAPLCHGPVKKVIAVGILTGKIYGHTTGLRNDIRFFFFLSIALVFHLCPVHLIRNVNRTRVGVWMVIIFDDDYNIDWARWVGDGGGGGLLCGRRAAWYSNSVLSFPDNISVHPRSRRQWLERQNKNLAKTSGLLEWWSTPGIGWATMLPGNRIFHRPKIPPVQLICSVPEVTAACCPPLSRAHVLYNIVRHWPAPCVHRYTMAAVDFHAIVRNIILQYILHT